MKKLKQNGIVVRLIDVVLILLFGFISISQIEEIGKIQLPISSEIKLSTPDTENLVAVAITPYEEEWGFLVDDETTLLKNIDGLHRYLNSKKEYFLHNIRVKIYSDASAPIKYTMQVADVCDRLQLEKSLIVKLQKQQSGLQTSFE